MSINLQNNYISLMQIMNLSINLNVQYKYGDNTVDLIMIYKIR